MKPGRYLVFALLVGAVAISTQLGCEAEKSPFSGEGDADTDGDSDSDSDADGDPEDLVSLRVTPTNEVLEVDLNTPATQAYTCTALFDDGHEEDYTNEVTWELEDTSFGSFNGATLEIPGITDAGARVLRVKATLSSNFVGEAQLTVVAYQMSGPQKDFFFLLPYNDAAGPQDEPLEFSTNVQDVDVFFDMDTTGSMGGTINGLQNSLNTTIIPTIQSQMTTAWFGVGAYEDFPIAGYGESNCTYGAVGGPDQPFELFQEMTDVVTDAVAGVNALSVGSDPIGCGNDGAESLTESLFQISTGYGLTGPSPTSVPPNSTGVGGVGFRAHSMPVIVPLTDIYSHNGINPSYNYTDASVTAVAATRTDAVTAMNAICARVVGVANSSGDPDMIAFAEDTGAVVPPEAWGPVGTRPSNCAVGSCCTGTNGAGRAVNTAGMCPLAYLHSGGSGLGDTIVTGIEMLTHYAAFDCETETDGETSDVDGVPLPSGYTTADFIQSIVPNSYVVPTSPPGLPDPTITSDGFDNVTPGTVVTFDITAFNDFVEETASAQWFEATISVLAGGCFPLDERTVMILVPPTPIVVD